MELDFEHFRSLIPIASLDDKSALLLARQAELEVLSQGDILFQIGDNDSDTVYVMAGAVKLTASDGGSEIIQTGIDAGLHPIASLKPRHYKAVVSSNRAGILRVNADLLDRLLTLQWESSGVGNSGVSINEFNADRIATDNAWMMSLLKNKTLRRLPAGHIQMLFEKLEEMPVKAGDTIVKQGDAGDYYYLIREGIAEVTRKMGTLNSKLAELKSPQSFGEEALLSDQPRNATVTMQTDGLLMRLAKADFEALLEQPTLEQLDIRAATQLVKSGAIPVDVRSESEYEGTGLKGALNLPLYMLRLKITRLDKKRKYLLYCDTGARSTAAAFLMAQQGFQVYVLENGLASASK